jgi:putative hydrolase of the HAD superfamily
MTMVGQFDAVVFDVGGVLSSSPTPLMVKRAIDAGIDIRQFAALVLGPLDVDSDHPYHQAERGEISFDAMSSALRVMAVEAGMLNMPTPPTGQELVDAIVPMQPMIDFAHAVRASGLKVGVLTNNIAEWGLWRNKMGVDAFADVVVDSCEVGMRKPHPDIYRLVLERLGGLVPERVLFLDDFEWNVRGAVAVGLRTIHVTDHAAAIAEARQLLGWSS